MPRKKTRRKVRAKKNKNILQKVLGLFLAVAVLTFGIYYFSSSDNKIVSRIAQKDNLQLQTFTPTPKPPKQGGACNHDNGLPAQMNDGKPVDNATCQCSATLVVCKNKKCVDIIKERSAWPDITCDYVNRLNWCGYDFLAPTDGTFCLGKPVIYLYPEKPTNVNVSVKTSGEVFVSDPQIEKGNKWTNVFAEPSGKLTYEGKNYRELFYESNVVDVKKPVEGLTLDSGNLRVELDKLITKLGLIKDEKTEFLDWWIPRLKGLDSKYIFFGLVEKTEKDRIDKVLIEPKPDTMIEFIAYFAPLDKPFEGKKLDLPSTPERIGFTAVEWGGTIGK